MRTLTRANRFLLILIAGTVCYAIYLFALPNRREVPLRPHEEASLPPGSFKLSEEAYDAISNPLFATSFTPPSAQLPNLKDELTFWGVNGRPDADPSQLPIHLVFRGHEQTWTVTAGERCYLDFTEQMHGWGYAPSPDNQETNLWIVPAVEDPSTVTVEVGMKKCDEQIVATPAANARFQLQAKDHATATDWQLDGLQVDNSLLARQRTRWHGPDLFLIHHGGSEYHLAQGRERVEFGEEEETYSCFVKEGDWLVWKQGRWHNLQPGESSVSCPLLFTKKIDDQLMRFELWDVEGKFKLSLSIMLAKTMWLPSHLKECLQFSAIKTWSRFVLDDGKERIEAAPLDWLLINESGWTKLDAIEKIDDYVCGRLKGELLVIEGLGRKQGKQVLQGQLFNITRSEREQVVLPLASEGRGPGNRTPPPRPIPTPPRPKRVVERKLLPEEFEDEEESLISLPKVVRGKIRRAIEEGAGEEL